MADDNAQWVGSTDDGPRLSRSGSSNAGGKLTHRLDIPVTEEVADAAAAMATLAGIPKAEYLRAVLERHFLGELNMARRMARGAQIRPWDESGSAIG